MVKVQLLLPSIVHFDLIVHHSSHRHSSSRLPRKAPEAGDGKYTSKSDVLAFAVLCFEVRSRRLPHEGLSMTEIQKESHSV